MANNNEIHIIQVNLARAYKANQSLNNFQEEEKIDISIVQEPYALNNKIIGFPIKHKIIAFEKEPKTAIIIHKGDISIFPIVIEQKMIVAKVIKGIRELLIINCYCPPHEKISPVLSKIENVIRTINFTEILIIGDFNSKNKLWGSQINDEKGDEMLEFIIKHNLIILNEKDSPPTFRTERAKGWIDLTITNHNLHTNIAQWEVLKNHNNSDHRYIKTVIKNVEPLEEYGITLKGQTKIIEHLQNDKWFTETQNRINNVNDIENVVNILYKKIEELQNRYRKKKQPPKQKTNPWWTNELEIERKRVRAYRRRYQRSKGDIRQQFKKEYYKEHDIYNNMLEEAKNNSWKQLCTKTTKNPFNLPYKIARNQIKTSIILRSIMKENGEITTSLKETVEYLLESLYPNWRGNVIEDITQEGELNKATAAKDENTSEVRSNNKEDVSIFNNDLPFTEAEVTNIVKNLRKDVAPGPDNLKTTFIQAIYDKHKVFFLNLFNACLTVGHFPKRWKQSKVILIPKAKTEGKPEENKYRPIAVNSILGKILEKLLKDRLYHFLHKNQLFQKYQFGFTHNTSTTKALQEIIKRIEQAKLDKTNCLIISLDIKNAFNSIKPKIVVQKLKEYNCHDNLIKLADNMLKERQIIYENDNVRICKTLTTGSPQGSPLSPLYWNLTISDLLRRKFPGDTHVQAFADDVVLIIKFKSRKDAEEKADKMIRIIEEWSKEKGIIFNKDKSNYMIVGKQYTSHQPQIRMGMEKIKLVQEMKILGVIIDNKLTFLPHLKYLKEKVADVTYKLSRTIKDDKNTNRNTLQLIYKRGIERMITYASPAWYTRKVITIKKLKTIQRLPMIMISKSFKTTSNVSLNILSKIPPVYLTIEKENEQYKILNEGKNFIWNNTSYTENQIMCKYDHWQNHPSKKISIPYVETEEHVDYRIYTDGSKKEQETGAAFVILDKENKILTQRKYKLPGYSSNYEAEVLAILKAIKHITSSQKQVKYQLFTDSLSALQALKNPNNSNPMICEIKNILDQSKELEIKLTYVKGHSGILGNTIADELAKEATKEGKETFIPISKTFISKQLQANLYLEWNKTWNKEGTNSYTYNWIKNVNHIPKHFPTNFYTSQALTGHGRFPFYFTRFNITSEAKCQCGKIIENFDHYLEDCPIVTKQRNELIKKLGEKLQNRKPEIIKSKETITILEEIVKKINDNIIQC